MNTREVISLQFGHYSNYVGAHFWNIQELSFDYSGQKATDINHDILFREGLTIDGQVTYTPRLLLADLKYSLKTLPVAGIDAPQDECSINWSKVDKLTSPKEEKNAFLKHIESNNTESRHFDNTFDFNSNVKTWTDFLYPRFHPRTVHVINEFKHDDDEIPFETHTAGAKLWKSELFCDVFTDNMRHYAEECDSIQGFQVTLDSTDGFGGLAVQCLYHLVDEFPNKSIFVIPLIASHFSDNNPSNQKERDKSILKDSTRLVNIVMTYDSLFECSNLFVPLCCGDKGWRKPGLKRQFYNVNYNMESYYDTSAMLASAIDTISLKYRQKNNQFCLSDICGDMTGYGRKMAAASLGLPFDMKQIDYLIDHLDRTKSPLYTTLTPNCVIPSDKVFQHLTIRGIPETKLKRPIESAKEQIKMAAYKCNTVKEMFEFYFQCKCYASATNVTVSPYGLEVKTPFPKIFSDNLDKHGFEKEFVKEEYPESVPVIAALQNGNFLFDTLESLIREAKRIKINKLHKFNEDGLEKDDYTNCFDRLEEMQSNYEDNFEL